MFCFPKEQDQETQSALRMDKLRQIKVEKLLYICRAFGYLVKN